MLSKAFSKSTQFIHSSLCHSVHCSMMFVRVKMWSVHPLPFQNPACSFLSTLSTAVESRLIIILLGSEVVPR